MRSRAKPRSWLPTCHSLRPRQRRRSLTPGDGGEARGGRRGASLDAGPVMGRGLTPQSVHRFGGCVQGKTLGAARRCRRRSSWEPVSSPSCWMRVPGAVARMVTDSVAVPTIGIGAGRHCDGQIARPRHPRVRGPGATEVRAAVRRPGGDAIRHRAVRRRRPGRPVPGERRDDPAVGRSTRSLRPWSARPPDPRDLRNLDAGCRTPAAPCPLLAVATAAVRCSCRPPRRRLTLGGAVAVAGIARGAGVGAVRGLGRRCQDRRPGSAAVADSLAGASGPARPPDLGPYDRMLSCSPARRRPRSRCRV